MDNAQNTNEDNFNVILSGSSFEVKLRPVLRIQARACMKSGEVVKMKIIFSKDTVSLTSHPHSLLPIISQRQRRSL